MTLRVFAFLMGLCLIFGMQTQVNAAEKKFSAAELKRMSIFLSNFTEIGLRTFSAAKILDEDNPYEMINFGIWHNYVNNFKSRVKVEKTEGEAGTMSISKKYVAESVKKYFAYDIKKHASVADGHGGYAFLLKNDRYFFGGGDGEAIYYARVQSANTLSSGAIEMTGYLYNIKDESDKIGEFTALANPYTFKGKKTWSIIRMDVME